MKHLFILDYPSSLTYLVLQHVVGVVCLLLVVSGDDHAQTVHIRCCNAYKNAVYHAIPCSSYNTHLEHIHEIG
jgi:hypothetical protein